MFSTAPLYRAILSVTLCLILSLPAAHGISQEEKFWSPKQVKETLDYWSEKYPQLFHRASAQKKYNIPYAGNATDCPYDDNHGCSQYFFTIQDFVRHPEGSRSSAHLPEVFWSGTFHGDELEGPSVVMEAAKMLLESAACEAIPGPNAPDSEIQEAKACRVGLGIRGINASKRQWLARLVATRRVVVMPSANSLGYSRGLHVEAGIDPARDFVHVRGSDSTECMRTTASRAINEIFRDHMFQIALSFYSGNGAIGFSWRSDKHSAPDRTAQLQLANALGSTASGGRLIYEEARSPNTLFENSDTLVDYVTTSGRGELQGHKGSFEDWAYAASWFRNTSACSPKTHGGYPPEKTRYNNSTNRALALLTSIDTQDIEKSMESNVNLALASVDLVQPYLSVFGVNHLALTDDIVPMNEAMSSSCLKTRSVISSVRRDSLAIEWTVGGALLVDYTDLLYAVNLNEAEEQALDCLMQPDDIDLSKFEKAKFESKAGGSGIYSEHGSDPSPDISQTGKEDILGPVFRAQIDIKDLKAGDRIVVIASARVDQNWNQHPPNMTAPTPKSHLANARTNPDWNHLHNGKRIRGRRNWFSIPLAIVLEDFERGITLEMGNRFSPSRHSDTETTQAPSSHNTDLPTESLQGPHETTHQGFESTQAPSSQSTLLEAEKSQETNETTEKPGSKKPKIDEDMHGEQTNDFTIASTLNNEAESMIWHLLVTLIIFLVLVLMIHLAKRRQLMDQMQSVMHAERTAGERGEFSHTSVPKGSNEDGEIIDFDNVGIYNKKKARHTTVRSKKRINYDPEVVGDVGDDNSESDSESDSDSDDDLPIRYASPPTQYVPPSSRRHASQSTRYTSPEDLEDIHIA